MGGEPVTGHFGAFGGFSSFWGFWGWGSSRLATLPGKFFWEICPKGLRVSDTYAMMDP